MYCIKCGKELKDGADFCQYCGQKQEEATEKNDKNEKKLIMDTGMISLLEEKKHIEKFTVLLNEVLKETDDSQLKAEVKSYMAEISQVYRFFVVGAEKTGRTTFLRKCFLEDDNNILAAKETEGIWELRYGVQETTISIESGYHKRFISNPILEGISLIDVGNKEFYKSERASELAKKSDVILAVFSTENIQDEHTWDFIEKNALKKKVICILTKTDLYPAQITEKKEKLLRYMEDLHLSVPIFAISDKEECSEIYEKIKLYMSNNIIGINPAEKRKKDNFYALIKIYNTLKNSAEKRKLQYQEDARVLNIMNTRFKEFYDRQEEEIENLKNIVTQTIREEINNYQNSILRQFDPKELKRNPNTQKKKVFMDWLQHEVNRYETILNGRISEQTNKVMRHYISEIDDICNDIQECMKERKIFLDINDAFYGSLAESKSKIVKKTTQVVAENHEDYQTLIQASEELFNKIWDERRKRDFKVAVTATTSTVGTAAISATILALASGPAAAVVAALVLGAIGFEAGKKLGEMYFDGKMEKNAEKYIEEFKEEIGKTRKLMESRTLEKLEELFENEFKSLDKHMLQFRTMNNIDTKNVPLLESRMQELEGLVEHWKREEKIYEYC